MYTALATTCQEYPAEYTYEALSATSSETYTATCTRYGEGNYYANCNGQPLILADSNFGFEQYESSGRYLWKASSDNSQLLFVLPVRVTLTTITLHYYSDSDRGLPRLRLYSVPDDFNIWNTVNHIRYYVEVAALPPGREPAGRRSININVNFNTKKVLMFKFSSDFQFAVTEVEFFTCSDTCKLDLCTSIYSYSCVIP